MFNLNAGEAPVQPPREKKSHTKEVKQHSGCFANLIGITAAVSAATAPFLYRVLQIDKNNPQAVQQEVNQALNEPQTIEQPAQSAEQQSETSEFAFGQPIPIDAVQINNWSTIVANLGIPHSYETNNAGRKGIVLDKDFMVTIIDDTGQVYKLTLSQAIDTFQLKPGHEVTVHPPQSEQDDVTQPESKQAPADQEAQTQLNPQEAIDQTIASSPEQEGFEVAQPPVEGQPQAEQTQAEPTSEQPA